MSLSGEQRVTLLAVLAFTVGILVWDYILLKDGIPNNTISSAFKTASACLPIPLLFGIWMAHSWWYQDGYHTPGTWRLVAFVGIVLASYLWWELSDDRVRVWLSRFPVVTFQVGFLAGHWIWPQFRLGVGG